MTTNTFEIGDFVLPTSLEAFAGLSTVWYSEYNIQMEALKKVNAQRIVYIGSSEFVVTDFNGPLLVLKKEYAKLVYRPPYKIGDTVTLLKTPVINEERNWGWRGREHFLKAGEKATIIDIGYRSAYLVFENDSWISSKGKYRLTKNKGHFYFPEHFFHKKVANTLLENKDVQKMFELFTEDGISAKQFYQVADHIIKWAIANNFANELLEIASEKTKCDYLPTDATLALYFAFKNNGLELEDDKEKI